MPQKSEKSSSHVIAGGKEGELGHCTHCGEGLSIKLPQPIEVIIAALRAFEKFHEKCPPGGCESPISRTAEEWRDGRDTGISSMTIYFVMTGKRKPAWCAVPLDPSDFGRCYRLLQIVPEWRTKLEQVGNVYPAWKPLIREWNKLELLYAAAIKTPDKPATEMYDLMKRLIKEGRARA